MRFEAVEALLVGHGSSRREIMPKETFDPADLGISDREIEALVNSDKIKPVVTAPSRDVRISRLALLDEPYDPRAPLQRADSTPEPDSTPAPSRRRRRDVSDLDEL